MQVTVYVSSETVRKIDDLARKKRISRSACVEAILKQGIVRETTGAPPLTTLSAFGGWKDIKNSDIRKIRKPLGKDAPRRTLR